METKKILKNLEEKQLQNKTIIKIESAKKLIEIGDENLKETLNFVKSKNLIKLNSEIKFENAPEIENYFKEELGNFLNEKYNDIHEKVSEIRKQGKEATVLTFKLMMIPLKIKMFLATCEKKDFEKVLNMIEEIKRDIPKNK
jgi:hypothetical protein